MFASLELRERKTLRDTLQKRLGSAFGPRDHAIGREHVAVASALVKSEPVSSIAAPASEQWDMTQTGECARSMWLRARIVI